LYGATGSTYVQGGGTLVSKNRDWSPMPQTIKYVAPSHGYRYLGLFAGQNYKFNAAGVNEKGLYVAMSTAGSVPKAERRQIKAYRSPDGLRGNEYLLRHAANVLEALSHTEIFKEPVNYILADNHMVAFVEVYPDGTHSVRLTTNGTLSHTNHYVTAEGAPFNKKIGLSSQTRYNRINTLLGTTTHPLTLWQILSLLAKIRTPVPDNSIFRTGSKPEGTQTLANFSVYLPPEGSPTIYVNYRTEAGDRPTGKLSVPRSIHFKQPSIYKLNMHSKRKSGCNRTSFFSWVYL
jgi:hypothetical protein